MANPRHLARAPVLEAILDIRVVPRPDSKIDDIFELAKSLEPKYSRSGERRNTDFSIELAARDNEPRTQASSEVTGVLLSDSSSKNRVQLAVDEFTQNVLGQYPDFEGLLAEARPNWERFKEVARPLAVSRLALRYVNDLRTPLDGSAIEDFLPVIPSVPAASPQQVADFVYRTTIVNSAIAAKAIVIQIHQGDFDQAGAKVILDIDVIIERQLAVDDSIWDRFALLRRFKNDIFFNFVSERLLRRYE